MKPLLSMLLAMLLLAACVSGWAIWKLSSGFSPTYKRVDLVSGHGMLYIKTKNWGVTGDHQVTVIDTRPELEFDVDETRQIVFVGLEPFRYQTHGDTLLLLVPEEVSIPAGFQSTWTITQKKSDDPAVAHVFYPPFKRI